MNPKLEREIKYLKEAWVLGLAIIEIPVLVFLALYLIWIFPIIGIILAISVGIHMIGKKLIEKGSIDKFFHNRPINKDAFIGGEEIR